jgi:hypothetical protein
MPPPSFSGVMIDVHEYQVFSPGEVAMSWDQHISTACSKRSQYSSYHIWRVVGEWSLAFTDCARYLNGRGNGARYDGSFPGSSRVGSCSPWTGNGNAFSSEYKAFLRKFWEAQVTGKQPLLIVLRSETLIPARQRGRRGAAGSIGHGRLRMPMSGAIALVSTLGGFRGIQTNAFIRVFAVRRTPKTRQPSC